MSSIGEVLHGGPIDASEVQRVRDILLFEEPGLRARLTRFWALLILASAIATYGLLGDSVATVIGAMIVAPLMLPIMGLAFGISIGDRKAIVSSLLVAISGIALAIGVGYLLSLPYAATVSAMQSTQILSRTSPRLLDLLAALATGLAGAFAMGRKDISDTLPGVAIAISLVPPLANVGILLASKQPDLAAGSALLFITNYLAIVLTGTFMFAVLGFPRAAMQEQSRRARVTALVIVAVLTVAILLPLAVSGYTVISKSLAEQQATTTTTKWLEGSDYRFVSANAGDDMVIVIAGTGATPPQSDLEASLRGRLYGLDVSLEVVPESRKRFRTN